MASGAEGPGASAGYVKEFTRHCSDVLLNLNELRHRGILTDATLAVGDARLRAHSAVLVACSGFFYSLSTRAEQHMSVSLPGHLEPGSVSLLLDFMYTSRLPLTPASAPGVLAVAAYLQMDHVADTCRDFMRLHWEKTISRHPRLELDPRVSAASVGPKGGVLPNPGPQAACRVGVPAEPVGPLAPPRKPASEELKKEPDSPPPSPGSPARCGCQPSSPAESKTCNNTPASCNKRDGLDVLAAQHDGKATLDPKSRNWKKYKYIILNPLCVGSSAKEEPRRRVAGAAQAWPGEVPGQIDRWEARRASRRVWGADPRGAGSASHRISSPDRGRPPATRVLAEPLPSGHPPARRRERRMDLPIITTIRPPIESATRLTWATPEEAKPCSQTASRTAATCAAPSSTGRPTSRRTLASTRARSRTAATPAAPDSFRWAFACMHPAHQYVAKIGHFLQRIKCACVCVCVCETVSTDIVCHRRCGAAQFLSLN
uniref:BCL6B transcription repressor n=1 Tax=Hippocampus comes TaxID=109280 RepID=A0A3Q2YWQ2_HIPCM